MTKHCDGEMTVTRLLGPDERNPENPAMTGHVRHITVEFRLGAHQVEFVMTAVIKETKIEKMTNEMAAEERVESLSIERRKGHVSWNIAGTRMNGTARAGIEIRKIVVDPVNMKEINQLTHWIEGQGQGIQ